MLTGPYINGAAVLVGAIGGASLSGRLPARLRDTLPLTFGICSMAMGIVTLSKTNHLPIIVFASVLGAVLGELLDSERIIGMVAANAKAAIERYAAAPTTNNLSSEQFLEKFVAIVILFCASGTGVFGAIHEGMTGDASILVTKAFLDFFTAIIFSASLGFAVAAIALPQFLIQMGLILAASFLTTMTTPEIQLDFSAVGGLLMLATGFRICGIRVFPVANMLPSLLLVMPLSAAWTHVIGRLLA